MMETTPPEKQVDPVLTANEWSKVEAQWLQYEDFISKVSKLRSPQPPRKTWSQRLFETSGGAALITVLIGGLLGQLISMYIQNSLKGRERQLAAYTKFLDQSSETVKHAYSLVGLSISAADNLISTTEPAFNPPKLDREQKKALDAQKSVIKDKYNETSTKWREEQYRLGLLMRYYHHNAPAVTDSWKSVQVSTDNYLKCSSAIDAEHMDREVEEATLLSCKEKKQVLLQALDALANSAESYWKDKEKSP